MRFSDDDILTRHGLAKDLQALKLINRVPSVQ